MELKQNIERAKQGSYFAALLGFAPLCPHLFMTQLLRDEVWWQRELGMKIGLEWERMVSILQAGIRASYIIRTFTRM